MSLIREKQLEMYDSMMWVKENTPLNSSFISVLLNEYRFLPVVTNRTFHGVYGTNIMDVIVMHEDVPFDYVFVWTRFDGILDYRLSEHFKEVYENGEIVVFRFVEEEA